MYIEIKNYTKVIKGNVILQDINYRFESGIIYGLKGKNGSGKTMLMRAISGLIRPSSGFVKINGVVLGKKYSFPQSIGVLIENPAFLPYCTGLENLEILAGIKNSIEKDDIIKTLNAVGLDSNDKRKYYKYSLGMKQKLGIAAAIMEHPEIIILDEPINAVDESSVLLIEKILADEKKRGAIIIIACHDTEELTKLADKIIYIKEGRLVDYNENTEFINKKEL